MTVRVNLIIFTRLCQLKRFGEFIRREYVITLFRPPTGGPLPTPSHFPIKKLIGSHILLDTPEKFDDLALVE
jgi:hypothetical protein